MAIPQSIQRFLHDRHIHYSVLHHVPAFTAQHEAAVTHTPGHMWAKTVVCMADGDPVLAVVPADRYVDVAELRLLMHARGVRVLTEREFESLFPDCEPGAMPPLGPLYGQRVFVDRQIASDDEIVFHAGSHTDAIRLKYEDFDRAVHPTVGQIAD